VRRPGAAFRERDPARVLPPNRPPVVRPTGPKRRQVAALQTAALAAEASRRDAGKVARGRGIPRTPGTAWKKRMSHPGQGCGEWLRNGRACNELGGLDSPRPSGVRALLLIRSRGRPACAGHPWLPSMHPSGMPRRSSGRPAQSGARSPQKPNGLNHPRPGSTAICEKRPEMATLPVASRGRQNINVWHKKPFRP
jgi:hypothetical protein